MKLPITMSRLGMVHNALGAVTAAVGLALCIRATAGEPPVVTAPDIRLRAVGSLAPTGIEASEPERWRAAIRTRDAAIQECLPVLADGAKPGASDDARLRAAAAVECLSELRASDAESLRALCRSIELRPIHAVPHPFNGYVAAQALARIGSRGVADAVMELLERPAGRTKLLLCAQVLFRIDGRAVALERLNAVRRDREIANAGGSHHIFLENSRRIARWLEDETFEREPAYMPH